ncbi:DDE-type integrase/transposase/recombinase [Rhodococcus opacus]|uniref:DDE-type integrase/transposase/recombinase n=1 Tax=Rhodococcus opacus TaxID=37919 RepID=UPI00358EF34C
MSCGPGRAPVSRGGAGPAVGCRHSPEHSVQGGTPTYVRKFGGWVYAAFVTDVFSRRVVGWQLSTSLRTDLALDALEMGIWGRTRKGQAIDQLIHHSDRGSQGGFNRSSQHRAVRTSVPVRQTLPLEFSNRALFGGGC